MPSDHATNAAATGVGYQRIQTDRGAGRSPRFVSRYEKPGTGVGGRSGGLIVAEGTSDVDQATADTIALAALNGHRAHVNGKDAANFNKDQLGNTTVADTQA